MELSETLQVIKKSIQDIIFPIFCIGCNKEGVLVCDMCYAKISCKGAFFCPVCHDATKSGTYCGKCAIDSYLDKHIAITTYNQNGLIGSIIHNLKYNFVEDLGSTVERMVEDFACVNSEICNNIDSIVPVPLHKRRYAERGFNQAKIIADIVGSIFDVPVQDFLERIAYTKHQARLLRKERLKNVLGAFLVKGNVQNKHILVVDDVFTTGATIEECAHFLKSAGAERVVGFTLARG